MPKLTHRLSEEEIKRANEEHDWKLTLLPGRDYGHAY